MALTVGEDWIRERINLKHHNLGNSLTAKYVINIRVDIWHDWERKGGDLGRITVSMPV